MCRLLLFEIHYHLVVRQHYRASDMTIKLEKFRCLKLKMMFRSSTRTSLPVLCSYYPFPWLLFLFTCSSWLFSCSLFSLKTFFLFNCGLYLESILSNYLRFPIHLFTSHQCHPVVLLAQAMLLRTGLIRVRVRVQTLHSLLNWLGLALVLALDLGLDLERVEQVLCLIPMRLGLSLVLVLAPLGLDLDLNQDHAVGLMRSGLFAALFLLPPLLSLDLDLAWPEHVHPPAQTHLPAPQPLLATHLSTLR
jgi:hypothetical protein